MADEKSKQAVQKTVADKKPAAKKEKASWKTVGKQLLLPASIVAILVGAGLVAYCFVPAVNGAFTGNVGMQVICVINGLCLLAGGILGVLKKSGKGCMALAVSSLVLAIIVMAATATKEAGANPISAGIVTIIASAFLIAAVDGWFDIGLVRYFREMLGELKKLTWLSGQDLVSHTAAVLVFVLGMAVLIYVLDLVFSTGFSAISKITIG
jgi:preprotein translocase SecE subunit